MRSRWWVVPALLWGAGCVYEEPMNGKVPPELSSLEVAVEGVWVVPPTGGARQPVPVVAGCLERYGNDASRVPAEVRGTADCRYRIPRGTLEVDVRVRAVGRAGQSLTDVDRPVSFRVVPGDLKADAASRSMQLKAGEGRGTVRANHVYGEVRVWVEDAPPQDAFGSNPDAGVLPGTPAEPTERSWATGVSKGLFFEDPTVVTMQRPDGADNRSSPLIGQFLTIGRDPSVGQLVQSCETPGDPNDGKPMQLVVTGADNSGFFVTDVTACRAPESVRTGSSGAPELFDPVSGQSTYGIDPEPDGMNPGRFASLYVYNYSYPEGLYPGDLLATLSGSVQEFTSTTQLTFPSWTIWERVHELPVTQWGKWLSQVPLVDITARTCGVQNRSTPYVTDVLCGHNTRNLKLESLESGLVRVRRVRMPEKFVNCDLDGDGQVSFFCDGRIDATSSARNWQDCNFNSTAPEPDNDEILCNIACTTGQGATDATLCSERSTYERYGQFVVEMVGPGPAEAGMEATLDQRYEELPLASTPQASAGAYAPGADVVVWCSQDVRYRFADGSAPAADAPVLEAGRILPHRMASGETALSVVPTDAVAAGAKCSLGLTPRTRMNVLLPDDAHALEPDCRVDDPDAAAAAQCRALRAATFDITGHLRHIQPGRPRWLVLPRDANDICCHPGKGLSCPQPIAPCP